MLEVTKAHHTKSGYSVTCIDSECLGLYRYKECVEGV